MRFTEHLMFLALMIPTFVLLAIAALLLAQPAQPSTISEAPAAPAVHVRSSNLQPVDERGYEGTY